MELNLKLCGTLRPTLKADKRIKMNKSNINRTGTNQWNLVNFDVDKANLKKAPTLLQLYYGRILKYITYILIKTFVCMYALE